MTPFIRINIPIVSFRRFAGFTVVELMVAIVVLGVLAAIAVPNMRVFILERRVTTQANDFVAALMYARSEAIRTGTPVVICKSANPEAPSPACALAGNWEQGWVIFVDSNDDQDLNGAEVPVRSGTPLTGSNTLRNGLAAMDNYVAYRPSGLVSPAPAAGTQAVFYFCDERGAEKARGVVIEPTGRAMAIRQNATTPLTCP